LINCTSEVGPTLKPKTFLVACGDGSIWVGGITWNSWTATAAKGHGILHLNSCSPDCADGNWKKAPTTIVLRKPVKTRYGPLYTVAIISALRPSSMMLPTSTTTPPPVVPSTTLAPPDVIGGSWEYLGFSASGEVVDIVLLTLVDFPPGQLTGSWSETAAPGYTSLALNGTECAGCNGVAGAYANDFNVTGVVHASTFSIEVQDNYNASFSGALGKAVPYGATSYGCVPLNSAEEMFLVSGSSAYDFFQPRSGLAIGSHASC
jgi:hypothetical protein